MRTLDPELPGEGFHSVPIVWTVFYAMAVVGPFAAAAPSGAGDQAARSATAEIVIRHSSAQDPAVSRRLAAAARAPVRHQSAIRR